MEKIINMIFIPECIFCKQSGKFFCDACIASCKSYPQKIFVSKSLQNQKVKYIFGFEYERFIRECIRRSKYRNKHFAALKDLSLYVVNHLNQLISSQIQDVNSCKTLVLAVPVSKAKLYKRGFNHAEEIAKIFAKQLNIKTCENALLRSKETSAQYTNNRKQRFENMQNAFEVKRADLIKDSQVILVDDVCTTGATFYEASKTLYYAGAKNVICVALARKSLGTAK